MRLIQLLTPFVALVSIACSSASSPGSAASGSHAGGTSAPPDASPLDDASGLKDVATPSDGGSGGDACPPVSPGSPRSIIGSVTLTPDSQGVPFGTQNGAIVHVAAADIVGKTLVWATAPGGEQIANLPVPTEAGVVTVGSDLTAHFKTSAMYTNGPWELAVFISVTGGNITKGPQPGDLAAFDLSPPPACEPPVTGVSIRVTIDNADANVDITNSNFIRF
ncbi:MAG TPA: hypothetical protein VMI75_27090 [Polyangiaceae bacterium]|nr:hypothetical protein [Polyangiaceae bacterium]